MMELRINDTAMPGHQPNQTLGIPPVTEHPAGVSNSSSNHSFPPLMDGPPTYAEVLIILMYSAIIVLAVGGNLAVCYTVLAYQRMRTVTNYFIVNLACSDILMAVLCVPFTFIANLILNYWPFGAIMCPIVTYVQAVVVFLSAFTLVAISLDRYIAIIYPLRRKMTTKQAVCIIVGIWSLSLLVPLPIAILSKVVIHPESGKEICDEVWPDERHRSYFSMAIMVLQYFLPLFVLSFTYARIGIIIWIKKPPGEAENKRDQRMAKSKRKMVKMMITVVIIYTLCWLPLHTITLVGDAHPDIYVFSYTQVIWIGCHWLAMSSCCYNPMVYCWMNTRYRDGFKHALRCLPCIKTKPEDKFDLGRNTCVSSIKGSMEWNKRGLGYTEAQRGYRRTRDGYIRCSKSETLAMKGLHNGCPSPTTLEGQYSQEDPGYSSGAEHTTYVNEHAFISNS